MATTSRRTTLCNNPGERESIWTECVILFKISIFSYLDGAFVAQAERVVQSDALPDESGLVVQFS